LQAEKHFKPEFLNRLSEIVIFEPLSQDKLRVVANVQLKGIIDRLAEKGINIYASEAVLDVVLSESHNPVSTLSSFLLTYMTLLCFFS
jgi:ATP-dependent Clp protease ATP-binding subunit ClpB